jgi:hypothetical protein
LITYSVGWHVEFDLKTLDCSRRGLLNFCELNGNDLVVVQQREVHVNSFVVRRDGLEFAFDLDLQPSVLSQCAAHLHLGDRDPVAAIIGELLEDICICPS